MYLAKVTVHKYKSFVTEQTFEVEKGITRIVGKNESGKSALLEIIAKTNYFENNADFKFSKELDYPRSELTKVNNDNPKAITCIYAIEQEDKDKIEEEFAPNIITSDEFSITTYYDNSHAYTPIPVNFLVFKNWIIEKNDIGDQGKELLESATDFDSLEDIANKETNISGMEEIAKYLAEIRKIEGNFSPLENYILSTFILPKLPKFWYFSDYFSLPYRINLNDLNKKNVNGSMTNEEYKIVRALFELSGLHVEDVLTEANFESFKAKLEATSNSITDNMFEYWTTNESLEICFDIEHVSAENRFLNIRIKNTKHRVTLPLKNRSKGFLWFFSFLVWFSKIQGDNKSKYILLLDEPGLSLHATAQNDLLRFIDEKLAPNYQVFYTTHSPFMIDSQKLNEVRTVYDSQDPKKGSIVSDAIEEKDSDTLFPLQAALGYTIAQNLYISPRNLLVEGVSDLVYLTHFSSILKTENREGLEDNITIVPVGGADKIATFISLMRGNQLDTVCLLDTFTNQQAKARLSKMVEEKIITENKILFYSNAVKKDFADIEDLFTKEEYLNLYNNAFRKEIKLSDLDKNKPIMNQLKRLNDNKAFNHYSPANYLVKNSSSITFCPSTLTKFETLFREINSLFA